MESHIVNESAVVFDPNLVYFNLFRCYVKFDFWFLTFLFFLRKQIAFSKIVSNFIGLVLGPIHHDVLN